MSKKTLSMTLLLAAALTACGDVPQKTIGDNEAEPSQTPSFPSEQIAPTSPSPTQSQTVLSPEPTEPSPAPTLEPIEPEPTAPLVTHQIIGDGVYHTVASSNSGYLVAWQKPWSNVSNTSWKLKTMDQQGQTLSPKGLTVLGSDTRTLRVSGLTDGYVVHDTATENVSLLTANGQISWQMNAGWNYRFVTNGKQWATVQDTNLDPAYTTITTTLGSIATDAPVSQHAFWHKGEAELNAIALSGNSVAVGYRVIEANSQDGLRLIVMIPNQNYLHVLPLHQSHSKSDGYAFIQKILTRNDGTFLVYWGVNHANSGPERYLTVVDQVGLEKLTVEVPWMHDVALATDGELVGVKADHDSQSLEVYRFSGYLGLDLRAMEIVRELKDRKFYYLGIAQVAVSGRQVGITYTTSPTSHQADAQIEMTTLLL